MLKNYFKIAWRNILKHKSDSLINIVGLCISFTCALLLFLSVYYEFSYDRFHKNTANIYHLYFNRSTPRGSELISSMPVPLTPALKQSYPEIAYSTRVINTAGMIRYKDKKMNRDLKLADPDFFQMFSFPFVEGNRATALNDLSKVVVRETAAKAIFGSQEPIGKTMEIMLNGQWKPFLVSGVIKDNPENSSITYDLIIRFENQNNYINNTAHWDNWNHEAYVQLKPGFKPEGFEKRTLPLLTTNMASDIADLKRDGVKPLKNGAYIELHLQPLSDIHTNTSINSEGGNAISKSYLYLLLTIGFLILLIACINFVNLGLGRSFTRTHEIGLRKTLGAQRNQLIIQFWSEAFLICLFALAISCGLTYFLLPKYKLLFSMSINRQLLMNPIIWLGVFAIFLLITLLAGGYPAWIMSRFNIIHILKGKLSINKSKKLRNSLIVIQFSIAILLMICTIIAWQQINYLRTKPLGYNRSQVISVPIEGDLNANSALQLMTNKLSAYSFVENISGIYNNLGQGLDGAERRSAIGFNYKNRGIKSTWMGVSYDFAKTLDLKLIAGRDFSRNFATDSNGVLINEAMAEEIGEKNLIGVLLPVHDSQPPKQIIGVVKNFNFESLHGKIEPLTMVLEKDFPINYILIKVKPENIVASMDAVKKTWKEIAPNMDFDGSFLDENVERQYKREEKLGKIFIYGAITAIFLSCMGLLAMVILIITQRIKEIGIRKVLGATAFNIVSIVSREFILLIFISFIIAAPLGWMFMHNWLTDFAYQVNVQWWWVFGLAGLLSLAIAMITISLQTLKAALTNPVKSLKTE